MVYEDLSLAACCWLWQGWYLVSLETTGGGKLLRLRQENNSTIKRNVTWTETVCTVRPQVKTIMDKQKDNTDHLPRHFRKYGIDKAEYMFFPIFTLFPLQSSIWSTE